MSLSRVYLGCLVALVGLFSAGCESSRSSTKTSPFFEVIDTRTAEALIDVKAVAIEQGVDGSFDLPVFVFDTVVLVVDTSGSMRELGMYRMNGDVVLRIARFLDSMPTVGHIELVDGSGQKISSWKMEGLSVNPGLGRMESLGLMVASLTFYPYESESNWLNGLRKAKKILGEDAAGVRGAVFIFGDEYSAQSFEPLEDLVAEEPEVPIYVVRAHEGVTRVNSGVRLEQFGSRIAELTGGSFFRFVPSDISKSVEALLLGRLTLDHPSETWIIDVGVEDVAAWNDMLRAEFKTERTFLVAKSDEEMSGVGEMLVSLREGKPNGFSVPYYVEYRSIDGTKVREYRATLSWEDDRFKIWNWELLKGQE